MEHGDKLANRGKSKGLTLVLVGGVFFAVLLILAVALAVGGRAAYRAILEIKGTERAQRVVEAQAPEAAQKEGAVGVERQTVVVPPPVAEEVRERGEGDTPRDDYVAQASPDEGAEESGEGGLVKHKEARLERRIRVDIGEIEILGSLDKNMVERLIHRHESAMRHCYQREYKRNPALQGAVAIQWVVGGRGRIASATVKSNTMGNRHVAECMLARIRSWNFPEPKGGGIVRVDVTWTFSSN